MLSNALTVTKETRVKILRHPVVQTFLDLKWEKMQFFIYLSMLFHVRYLNKLNEIIGQES